MRIVTLVENDTENSKLNAAHGLCLYIETMHKKILFDLGPNNYYIKNAKKLGIDISKIDVLLISHGHNDHGSGLAKFMKLNKTAKIYVSKHVFEKHIKQSEQDIINIGIKKPMRDERLIYIDKNYKIDDELSIISEVVFTKQVITDNKLKKYVKGRYIEDDFNHEIYLVIKEFDTNVLVTGCSHKGIENIVSSIETSRHLELTHVIGGYHFNHYDSFNFQQVDYLNELGKKFSKKAKTTFYSCHCTGDEAFFELKRNMKDKIKRLKTGTEINI